MAITIKHQEFEAATRRGVLSARSARMNTVLAALLAHEQERSPDNIDRLKRAMDAWQTTDPKEVANRNKDQIIYRLGVEILREQAFCRQFQIAAEVANDLLRTRWNHFVNDADTSDANRPALQASTLDVLKTVLVKDASPSAMLASLGTRNRSHWETKGIRVAGNPNMDIRCGESAALVVHALRNDARFDLPLSIIEQGRGSIDGHFWVVAGAITRATGVPSYGADTMTIDIWGAATGNIDAAVLCPAQKPFTLRTGDNKLKTLVTWRQRSLQAA